MTMLVDVKSDRRSPVGSSFGAVLNNAVGGAAAKLSGTVDDWTDRLNDVASGSRHGLADATGAAGAKGQAVAAGATAAVTGKNPLWAALNGAWSGASTGVKATIVAALVAAVLLLVLSPVLLLVLLVSILIVVAVAKARSAKR